MRHRSNDSYRSLRTPPIESPLDRSPLIEKLGPCGRLPLAIVWITLCGRVCDSRETRSRTFENQHV
jgi:hypothetical protein